MKLGAFLNGISYLVGSIMFIVASLFFHPALSTIDVIYKTGVILFIVGSVLFLLPAMHDWVTCYHHLCNFPRAALLSFNAPQDAAEIERKAIAEIERVAIAITRSSAAVLNGVLFVVGSVAYWPDFGRPGIIVGNWLFRMGTSMGLLSTCWALRRTFTQALLQPNTRRFRWLLIAALFGSLGFLMGGACFLAGESEPGAIAWAVGSVFYLVSSCIQLSM